MKHNINGLNGYATVEEFVEAKLDRLQAGEPSFRTLFELMFSERENVMYERSAGYRIETTTYGAVRDAVLHAVPALCRALAAVPAQSVVGLYMRNGPEWIAAFWTILAAGYRPLLMNTRMDAGLLEETLRRCGAAAVISDGPGFSVPTLRPETLTGEDPAAPDGPFGDDVLVMSSGTSASIKLCAYSAEQFRSLISDSVGIIRQCKPIQTHYEGDLKLLTFLPFYHVFGLIAVYIWFGFFSRTFVHLADFAPETILGTIRRHKVTHIFAVPLFWETVYAEAMRRIRARGEETAARFERGLELARALGDLPGVGAAFSRRAFREVRENLFGESVSFMITGGSEIQGRTLEFFNAIGYPLANGYGMTEIGITSVELSSRPSVRASGTVGAPFASVEYTLAPDGELLVRGGSLAHCVIEGEARRENDGGWFHTGDLAAREDGRYRILGRMDDLVVASDGENLNPTLIEPRFEVPGVRQVCLIAGPDRAPVLLASVGRHLPAGRLEQIERALRERASELGLTGRLKRIVTVEDDLMAEGDFKLCRGRLAGDYAAGRLTEAKTAAGAAAGPEDPCYAHVLELFATALGMQPGELGPDTDFFLDGGGSSLDYFALISRLREEYSVEFPTENGESLSTPLTLYSFIRGDG